MEVLNLLGVEIAENMELYYNEGKVPALKENNDPEQV